MSAVKDVVTTWSRVRRRAARFRYSTATRESPQPQAHALAYFFMNQPSWVLRHVETWDLGGLRDATRKLTIDLELPTDARAMIAHEGPRAVYFMPVARMSKSDPLPFVDLRDEQGAVVPLRTRAQNADSTLSALEQAVRSGANLGTESLPPGMQYMLRLLVVHERPQSDWAAEWLLTALTELAFEDQAVRGRIEQVITHLIINSVIWVPLSGAPGEHRVVKLAASIDLGRPRLPVRKPMETKPERHGLEFPDVEDGPIDWTASVRVIRAALAARIGWDSIDIKIRDPTIQDPLSFHLQVLSSPGLTVDRIEFDPDRETHHARTTEPVARGGHLYFRDPNNRLQRAIPLSVSMRASRRGFINLCALSTVLITALLWSFQAAREAINQAPEGGAVAAAVLLIAPPFLVLMSGRTAETPLVSTLLSGIRLATVTCIVVAAMAAAAIGGVRPTTTLSASLIAYASAASVCTCVIVIAWLGCFSTVRRIADAVRCRWCGADDRRAWSWASLAAMAIATFAAARFLDDRELAGAVVAALSLAVLVSAFWPDPKHIPLGARSLAFVATFAGTAWASSALWTEPAASFARDAAIIVIGGCLALSALTALAIWLAPVRPRAPTRTNLSFSADGTDTPVQSSERRSSFQGQTPTMTSDADAQAS